MIEGVKARSEPRALRAPLLLALAMAACQSRALRDGPRADVADRPATSSAARAASARRPALAPAPSASAARASELEIPSLPPPCGASDRAQTLAPGASVLVAPLRANYLPARVEAVEVDGTVRVESWTGNSFTVERDRVYPLDRPHPTAEVAGCYGGCKTGDLWVACRVLSGDERRVRIEDHAGAEHTLPRADLVVFEPALQRQVRTFLAESRYREAFRAAVEAAGSPAVPAGYRPAVGEVVLVASGLRYLTAEVVAVTARDCSVRWFGDVRTPSTRPLRDVVPLPRSELDRGPAPVPGDVVLAKAREDHGLDRLALTAEGRLADPSRPPRQSLEWQPYRVLALGAAGELVLGDRDGRRRTERAAETIRYRR